MALKHKIGELGWYNFERLVKTLLKKVIAPGVTSFGGSKDGGRDATFSGSAPYPSAQSPWSGAWVFQVKYVDPDDQGGGKAARSALKSKFKSEALSIWRRRKEIDNYVLITNVPLSPDSRDALRKIVADTSIATNFAAVDGNEVCEWLDVYPELRRSFPQLLGLSDLSQIINSAIYSRSKAYCDHWGSRLALFVQTDAYVNALKVLNKFRFLVLDGPPETGKSMIAAAVAMVHAYEGFEVYDVRSPEDVHRVLREPGKKIFIADDAIGSISLESDKNDAWARDLPGIIRSLDKERLLVWTARHYILEAALAGSSLGDSFDNFPGEHEVVVEVGDLREVEKAEILYNHAKRAGLSPCHREVIRNLAVAIVVHPNFTPERVRQIVEYLRNNPNLDAKRASAEIIQFLTNPGERWSKAFRALSPSEQTLLISLLDHDESSQRAELQAAYERRIADTQNSLTFDEALSRLKHSFVTINRSYQGAETIDFKHPSLQDLLITQLRGNTTARRRYIQLTSPSGLAKLIQGFATRRTDGVARG
jgi:hypothetical protein